MNLNITWPVIYSNEKNTVANSIIWTFLLNRISRFDVIPKYGRRRSEQTAFRPITLIVGDQEGK